MTGQDYIRKWGFIAGLVLISLIIAWAITEFLGWINLILIEFPYSLPFWVSVLGTVATLLLTGALVWLYGQQKSILSQQVQISKYELSPHIVGPYDFRYDSDERKFSFKLSNVGGGVAKELELVVSTTFLDTSNQEFETQDDKPVRGAEHVALLEREEQGFIEPSVLRPDEVKVGFHAPMRVVAYDRGADDVVDIYEVADENMMEGIDFKQMNIRFSFRYEDGQGNDQNPYGEDYQLIGPATVVRDLDETYNTLSIFAFSVS